MVTNFTNQPFFFQKHMSVAFLADTLACVVYVQDLSITTKEDAWDIAEVTIAAQTGSVNEGYTQ